MRMQIDRMQQDIDEYRRQLDLAGRDNKRLQEDLMNLTREKQVKRFLLIVEKQNQNEKRFFIFRKFFKNSNERLMIKKIRDHKFRNTSNKCRIVKMSFHKKFDENDFILSKKNFCFCFSGKRSNNSR